MTEEIPVTKLGVVAEPTFYNETPALIVVSSGEGRYLYLCMKKEDKPMLRAAGLNVTQGPLMARSCPLNN